MSRNAEGAASDGAARKKEAEDALLRPGDASGDSPKRQGDKLGAGTSAVAEASRDGIPGDSAKPHGDKLEHAVKAAARS